MSVHTNFHIATDHILSVFGWNIFFSSFQFFPTWPSFFLKTHNQLGNGSDMHRGRPWCYIFFPPEPTTSLAREDGCNFTAFSSTFLPGFSLFNVGPLSSAFSLSLFMLTIFLALQCTLHALTECKANVDVHSDSHAWWERSQRSYHQVKSQGRQPKALRDIVVTLCYSVFDFAPVQSACQAMRTLSVLLMASLGLNPNSDYGF